MYYGGHGKIDGTKALWMAELSESSGNVDWSSAQITLASSICDKLFLFDCCYAGATIDRKVDWYGRTELLGSSKPHRKADSRERASFTKALIHELGTPGRDVISIWEDFNDVDKLEEHGLLKGDPFYQPYTGRQVSIVLNSLNPNWTQSNVGSPNSRRQSSARILIKVAFSDTMPQIVAEWKTFVSHAPHNVLRLEYGTGLDMDVHLKALFPSDSCTALFEIPLRLWAAILPDSIETYFSTIRGDLWFPGEIFPTTQMLYQPRS